MPRLLTIVPCEKVLFGEDQTVSLVVVLAEIHFRIFPNISPPPPGATVFFNWAIFCQWQIGLGEETEEWEQSLSLVSKSGQLVFTNNARFEVPSAGIQVHRMVASLDMVPFLPEGQYEIIARWRKVGDDEESWKEGGRYPMRVVYDHISLPVTAPTT
jgi:hypothetical protein